MGAAAARILVAEDDHPVRKSLCAFLEDNGFDPIEAADGHDALEVVYRSDVNLVLIDLHMPRLSGLELLANVRANKPELPVVVISGTGTMVDVVEALRLGAWDFIIKPIEDLKILRHAIDRSLERARLLAENRRHQSQLEEKVKTRTLELQKANAAKDEFLALVSHELRTPLTPILLILSSLERDESLSSETRAELAMASQQAQVAAQLIDRIFDVTRIMSGRLELQRLECNIHSAIESAITSCQPLIDEKGINLRFLSLAGNPRLQGDIKRIKQAFYELIDNAVKFTSSAGEVTISTGNVRTGERELVEIQVHDSGIGMNSEILGRIFTMFEQADRSTRRNFGGMGIGLTICKAIIELHGGTVDAASDGINNGSLFTVRLPIC